MSSNAPTDEFDRLARQLEETARLWREHGKRALEVTESWENGPRSAAMEPSFSWSYTDCDDPGCVECPNPEGDSEQRTHKHPLPADPTGEAVLTDDERAGRHKFLRAQVAKLDDAAHQVRKVVKGAVPAARLDIPRRKDESREEISRDGWCVSCYRVDKRCEPTATRVNKRTGKTETVYSEFCYWCGAFVADWRHILGAQGLPPIELVRLHHTQGKRVTEAKVLEAMTKVAGRTVEGRAASLEQRRQDIADRRDHRLAG